MVDFRQIIDRELIENDLTVLRPASKFKRLLNLLIDYLGFLIFGFMTGVFLNLIGMEELIFADVPNKNVHNAYIAGGIIFLYYLLCEFLFRGKTLGKFLTKTKVVTTKGEVPSFLTLVNRSVYRFIPFTFFTIFFLKKGGWHDQLSKTIVVEDN